MVSAAVLPVSAASRYPCRPCENSRNSGEAQGEERAMRDSERLGLIGLTRPRGPRTPSARIEPRNPPQAATAAVMSGLDTEDVERSARILGERGQAELGAHVGEAAHQRR